jgi:hypothetical protein
LNHQNERVVRDVYGGSLGASIKLILLCIAKMALYWIVIPVFMVLVIAAVVKALGVLFKSKKTTSH